MVKQFHFNNDFMKSLKLLLGFQKHYLQLIFWLLQSSVKEENPLKKIMLYFPDEIKQQEDR